MALCSHYNLQSGIRGGGSYWRSEDKVWDGGTVASGEGICQPSGDEAGEKKYPCPENGPHYLLLFTCLGSPLAEPTKNQRAEESADVFPSSQSLRGTVEGGSEGQN